METEVFIVASIIIVAFVLFIALPYIVPRRPNVPVSYPVKIEGSQIVKCVAYTTVSTKDYNYVLPKTFNLSLSLYAKSFSTHPLQIEKIIPYGEPNNVLSLFVSLRPGELYMNNFQPPWGPLSKLTTLVFPGDVVYLKGMQIKINPGTIYSSSAPISYIEQVPSSFNCPFNGNNKYTLEINGEEINSTIKTPGCAGVILKNISYANTYLLLSDYKIGSYYYKKYDIPFFLMMYNSKINKVGFYRKAYNIGILYNTQTKQTNINDSNYQAVALYYNGKSETLYLDNSTSPVLIGGSTNTKSGYLVMGVAREKPANIAPLIKICAVPGSTPTHCTIFNPGNMTFELIKSNGQVIEKGHVPVVHSDEWISNYLRKYSIVVYYNPNPGSSDLVTLRGNKVSGTSDTIKVYMQPLKGAEKDMIIIWEDLVGTYPPGSSRIDGNGDEWIHVTYFKNGTWRVASYISRGGYEHQFYINNHLIFTKPHGAYWKNEVNGIFYEYKASFFPKYYYYPFHTAPLSSFVKYVGMFKDGNITIKGLVSGDHVIISAGGVTKTYLVNSSQLTINLLSVFTPIELIDAIESGGIGLTIVPTSKQILNLIPTNANVLVKSKNANMWVDMYMPVKILCNLDIEVHSYNKTYTTILNSTDYTVWNLIFNGKNMGTYPKVDVHIYNGTITAYSKYGVYVYRAPDQDASIYLTTAPIDYIGLEIGTSLIAIPYTYKIVITGTAYYITFSYGK